MPEMWAHCESCRRWFFIPFATGAEMACSACPVCAQAPDRFEVRLEASTFPVEMTVAAALL